SVHSRDGGRLQAVQRANHAMDVPLPAPACGGDLAGRRLEALLHGFDVAPGAKRGAFAGEDQGTDAVVSRHAIEDIREGDPGSVVHGVAYLWPVQGSEGDAVLDAQLDRGIC